MVTLIAVAIALAVGFGAGRIHSAKTVAALKAEAVKIEAGASADVKALIAKIKAL